MKKDSDYADDYRNEYRTECFKKAVLQSELMKDALEDLTVESVTFALCEAFASGAQCEFFLGVLKDVVVEGEANGWKAYRHRQRGAIRKMFDEWLRERNSTAPAVKQRIIENDKQK